ncbi:MAG: hypothetical protein PHZ11_10700 [Desulfitobacteriaceae bacterium]|nr:hypothetical protein [Desulfitobacteriaceae bacterium]MDD4347323.1 hypothetical protein [Desulfitobacteriaceae bacterium]
MPTVEQLNYNYLEGGVDDSNFVTELDKTAAPVALVLQIQTSWHMFDLAHANRLKTDLPVNGTNVGAALYNTELVFEVYRP